MKDDEFQLLVLRALAILISRLPYTGILEAESPKDQWHKDVNDFTKHWHPEHP